MTGTATTAGVSPRLLAWLTLVLGMAGAPLALFLHPGIIALFYTTIVLRLALLRRPGARSGRFLLALLTLSAFVIVLIAHHGILGRDAGTSLLTIMVGLKLLEVRSSRDVFVGVFLGFFLIVTQFLFSRSIPLTVYLVAVTLLLIALLWELNQAEASASPLPALKQALALVVQAAPVMAVLFVLFPRLSAPLWNLYTDDSSAVSGFSDRLEPGSIRELSLSDKTAFRADFSTEPPPPRERYWRGQVFWETDGRRWYPGAFDPAPRTEVLFSGSGEPARYTITLEPHRKRWMFALDLPAEVPANAGMGRDFQILSDDPIFDLRQYSLVSYTHYSIPDLPEKDRRRALRTPANITSRMRSLVDSWLELTQSPAEVVNQALTHFNQENFVYTLLPPMLGANPDDEFLFETRRGFCEHFATSFTLLMRVAGVPTRVVTGYQGGEYNRHGGYFIVRQADAHAWTEVWLEGRGWVRVDPTAAVAPERIELPIDTGLSTVGAPIRFRMEQSDFLFDMARHARLLLDAVNMGWNQWVLRYSTQTQTLLLARVGLDFIREKGLGITLVLISGAILLALAGFLQRQDRVPPDPVQKLYLRFCSRLTRRGIRRRATEGPRDYGRRVIRRRPDLAGSVEQITSLYLALRYGRRASGRKLRKLKQLVSQFRP